MTSTFADVRRLAGEVGAASVANDPDRLQTARENLAEARVSLAIAKVLADAPPLRPEQRERLCALLNGGE